MGSYSLLKGIFPTQRSNSGLLHCRQILYCLSHQGSKESLNEGEIGIWKAGLKLNIQKTKITTSGPIQFSSVQSSRSVMSDSLGPHESQHPRPPCPSQTTTRLETHLRLRRSQTEIGIDIRETFQGGQEDTIIEGQEASTRSLRNPTKQVGFFSYLYLPEGQWHSTEGQKHFYGSQIWSLDRQFPLALP